MQNDKFVMRGLLYMLKCHRTHDKNLTSANVQPEV